MAGIQPEVVKLLCRNRCIRPLPDGVQIKARKFTQTFGREVPLSSIGQQISDEELLIIVHILKFEPR